MVAGRRLRLREPEAAAAAGEAPPLHWTAGAKLAEKGARFNCGLSVSSVKVVRHKSRINPVEKRRMRKTSHAAR